MSHHSKILVVFMVAGFLAGCVSSRTVWVKRNVSTAQMENDLKSCAEAAGLFYNAAGTEGAPLAYTSQGTYNSRLSGPFEKCMTGKGYRKEK